MAFYFLTIKKGEILALLLIPDGLQKLSKGKKELNISGMTFSALIGEIKVSFPELYERVFNKEGRPFPFVRIFVDGRDLVTLDPTKIVLQENSKVQLLIALAGG